MRNEGWLAQIVTPGTRNRLELGVPWAADAGTVKIVDGAPVTDPEWDPDGWLRFLLQRRIQAVHMRCLFAVVPDCVSDSAGTDARWTEYVNLVQSLGFVPAYVTQNGCETIPTDAGALFTGGDDAWKLGPDAQELVVEAKARGLWCHMGRVNSLRRLRYAYQCGYDSVDGNYLRWPDVNLPKLRGFMAQATAPALF